MGLSSSKPRRTREEVLEEIETHSTVYNKLQKQLKDKIHEFDIKIEKYILTYKEKAVYCLKRKQSLVRQLNTVNFCRTLLETQRERLVTGVMTIQVGDIMRLANEHLEKDLSDSSIMEVQKELERFKVIDTRFKNLTSAFETASADNELEKELERYEQRALESKFAQIDTFEESLEKNLKENTDTM